jgi:carbon monoxide dehydrogenase subunit G
VITVSDSIEIPAAPEHVVGTIADLDTWGDWLVIHAGFAGEKPETVAPGMSFKERVKILGMPGEVEWTVTDIQLSDPGVIAMEGKGPMGTTMEAKFSIASDGEGTKVSYDASYGGAALTPLLGQLEKATKEASAESLAKLRDLVAAKAAA